MPDETDWLVIGDFNLIRRQTNRNRPGGNIQDMLNFNDAISYLRLEELRLIGNKFIWTNKQESPLLERLDWFFASASWMANYLGSSVSTLSRDTSDHYSCLVSITTDIPKAKKKSDLRIIGCFMMDLCKSWNLDGIQQFFSLIKQKRSVPNLRSSERS
jgi:hypothetical protein